MTLEAIKDAVVFTDVVQPSCSYIHDCTIALAAQGFIYRNFIGGGGGGGISAKKLSCNLFKITNHIRICHSQYRFFVKMFRGESSASGGGGGGGGGGGS